MATAFQTIGDLFAAKEVSAEDLDAVSTGWLEDRIEGHIPIGRHAVDVSAAVEAFKPARDALQDESAHEDGQRAAIREAILLAPAAKA